MIREQNFSHTYSQIHVYWVSLPRSCDVNWATPSYNEQGSKWTLCMAFFLNCYVILKLFYWRGADSLLIICWFGFLNCSDVGAFQSQISSLNWRLGRTFEKDYAKQWVCFVHLAMATALRTVWWIQWVGFCIFSTKLIHHAWSVQTDIIYYDVCFEACWYVPINNGAGSISKAFGRVVFFIDRSSS